MCKKIITFDPVRLMYAVASWGLLHSPNILKKPELVT